MIAPPIQQQQSAERFRDLSSLTKWVQWMLIFSAAIEVIHLGSRLMTLALISGDYSVAQGEADDQRSQIMVFVALLTWIVVSVPFCTWISRANRNIWAFNPTALKIKPAWAVGYFFVPFANLYKPFEAMRDLWHSSINPYQRFNSGSAPVVGWWWGLWISEMALERLTMASMAEGVDGLRIQKLLELGSSAVHLGLCFVAANMVSTIWRNQQGIKDLVPPEMVSPYPR